MGGWKAKAKYEYEASGRSKSESATTEQLPYLSTTLQYLATRNYYTYIDIDVKRLSNLISHFELSCSRID